MRLSIEMIVAPNKLQIDKQGLDDTRKARLLGSNGTYSLPRAARNVHGFSVQEHLMRLASEGPRNMAISAPLDHTVGERQGGAASDADESSANAASNATV